MSIPSYVHAIEGRLRIKIAGIKHSEGNAARVKSDLEELAGIRHVNANPATGNVLVLFDPSTIDQEQIIAKLNVMKSFEQSTWRQSDGGPQLSGRIAETLVQSALQMALERVILALV